METENGTEVPQKHKEGGSIVMAMLEVKNLGISFGGLRAVDDFHISIEKGQLYGLIGPNGAGKSTILKSLTRQLKLVGGTVYLDQKLMSQMSGKEVAQDRKSVV